MKKAVYSLMILMLLLPLAACGKKKAPEDAADVGAAPDNHAAETAEDADVGAAPNGYTIGYLASNGGDEWLPAKRTFRKRLYRRYAGDDERLHRKAPGRRIRACRREMGQDALPR